MAKSSNGGGPAPPASCSATVPAPGRARGRGEPAAAGGDQARARLGPCAHLLLGLGGGFSDEPGMLGRVDAINRTTRQIMAGDLSQRIALKGPRDEFDQLAANLNAMLDQIERLLGGMRQVTDNIAHDLRTPLNWLRSRIEVALLQEPGRAETRALLEATLADAQAMIATFNALLDIARAEAGSERGGFEVVDLEALGHDLADLYRPAAEDKQLTLEYRRAPVLQMRANRHLLAQALANLLDNAIKYTPPGGRVDLEIERGASGPIIAVADNGPAFRRRTASGCCSVSCGWMAHARPPATGSG